MNNSSRFEPNKTEKKNFKERKRERERLCVLGKEESNKKCTFNKKQQSSVKKTKNGKGDKQRREQQQQQPKTKQRQWTELHADMSSCFLV